MADNKHTLWLAIIAASVNIEHAANSRVHSERTEYRNGMLDAYSIITGYTVDDLTRILSEAIANLHLHGFPDSQ